MHPPQPTAHFALCLPVLYPLPASPFSSSRALYTWSPVGDPYHLPVDRTRDALTRVSTGRSLETSVPTGRVRV